MNNTKIDIIEPILLEVGKIADKNNFEVYVVGGYVRDYFLNKKRSDIDCTVCGDVIKFAEIVANHFKTKLVVYERFRTALVPIGQYHIEFVGTRQEKYLPTSRKPITYEGSLEDDLRRRDFTVNAMAASINHATIGKVIDLFDGITHLKQKKLITPLEPEITFEEDPLRMMRAARFASQLDFKLDENAVNAIKKMPERINIISQERKTDEFLKIIATKQPSIGLSILYKVGLLEYIFPELNEMKGIDVVEGEGGRIYAHKDTFWHSLKVLDNIATNSDNLWLRFAALVHDIGKIKTKRFVKGSGWHFFGHEEKGARMMDGIFRRMRLPLEHIDYVKRLINMHLRPMQLVSGDVTDSAIRRLAVQAGDTLEDLFLLCRSDITSKNVRLTQQFLNNYDVVAQKVLEVQEKDKLREFQSPVRGEEIMEICEIPPGRMVGIIKTYIENAILDGIIPNEYEAAKAYFLENKDSIMQQQA